MCYHCASLIYWRGSGYSDVDETDGGLGVVYFLSERPRVCIDLVL